MQRGKTFEDPSIGNFVFIITPTEAIFNRPNEHKRTLTLQKGMQTLGTLQQTIPIITKQHGSLSHKFQPGATSISFRIINDKNLNYQWSVYKVFDGGQLEEIDCMQFSIQNFWRNYIGEYEKHLACLNIKTKDEKDQKKMLEIWKQINQESQLKTANLRVAFNKADFRLDFQIQARSILDEQLEEYEKQKLMRKLREYQKSQIRRSAITLTSCGLQEELTTEEMNLFEKIKRARTEENDKLNPNTLSPMSRNFLLPIKQKNQALKKVHSNNQSSTVHKARFNDETLQISSDLHNSLKKANSFERRESIKDAQKQENLQLSSMIKHEKTKTPQSSKIENYSTQSIKMVILYIVLGILMLWLMYNLMGHQSKVEYKTK